MGFSSYSVVDKATRVASGMYDRPDHEVFKQQVSRTCHAEMNPNGVSFREARDSDTHPNTVPVQLFLDVTGSMGAVPRDFIKDGLPTMIGTIIQSGIPDVALMFGAVGDHECDKVPLQVGQFESGDEELDMWLQRTFLEGGGGGNAGESYGLAWYFAANHVKTDAWEKRSKKGFVFTIGDEPVLPNYPASAIKQIMGDTAAVQGTFKISELLLAAQKQNNVFHIFLTHGSRRVDDGWRDLLGQHLLVVDDYRQIPALIAKTVLSHTTINAAAAELNDNAATVSAPAAGGLSVPEGVML